MRPYFGTDAIVTNLHFEIWPNLTARGLGVQILSSSGSVGFSSGSTMASTSAGLGELSAA